MSLPPSVGRKRTAPLVAALVAAAASSTAVVACSASGAALPPTREGPCTPAAGTYQIVYANESDAAACSTPATVKVTVPDPSGVLGLLDGGLVCDSTADCTETCSGVFEGFAVASTTTIDAAATSYSGITYQTVAYPDGAALSQCAYSYQATRQ